MAVETVRRQISHEVRRALSAAGLTAAAAARKMPPDERGRKTGAKTIYRWLNAEVTPPLDRLQAFAAAIEQPLDLNLGPDIAEEAPRPDWVEGLLREVRLNRAVIQAAFAVGDPGFVQRVMDRLATLEGRPTQRGGEAPAETGAAT